MSRMMVVGNTDVSMTLSMRTGIRYDLKTYGVMIQSNLNDIVAEIMARYDDVDPNSFEISIDSDYDAGYECSITFKRLETVAECDAREQREAKSTESRKHRKEKLEQEEYAEFQRLKKIYGDK